MVDDKSRILVVGSINMDLAVKTGVLPAPGETVRGDSFAATPGGKGANQAVAISRLGGTCDMIGRVGEDVFGQQLRESLAAAGVNISAVTVTPGRPSGVAMIVVDGTGENSVVVASGANWSVTPDDVFGHESLFAAAAVVVLQLELPLETVMAACKLARKHNCRIILDPAPAPADLPLEMMAVDILTPNEREAEILTGQALANIHVAKGVGAELVARGARTVVLKLGSAGAMIVTDQGQIHHIPPYRVNVVDTTAAGDAFAGALAVAMSHGSELIQAVKFANAAGALAASKRGAQQAMPSAQQVKFLMEDQPM